MGELELLDGELGDPEPDELLDGELGEPEEEELPLEELLVLLELLLLEEVEGALELLDELLVVELGEPEDDELLLDEEDEFDGAPELLLELEDTEPEFEELLLDELFELLDEEELEDVEESPELLLEGSIELWLEDCDVELLWLVD